MNIIHKKSDYPQIAQITQIKTDKKKHGLHGHFVQHGPHREKTDFYRSETFVMRILPNFLFLNSLFS